MSQTPQSADFWSAILENIKNYVQDRLTNSSQSIDVSRYKNVVIEIVPTPQDNEAVE